MSIGSVSIRDTEAMCLVHKAFHEQQKVLFDEYIADVNKQKGATKQDKEQMIMKAQQVLNDDIIARACKPYEDVLDMFKNCETGQLTIKNWTIGGDDSSSDSFSEFSPSDKELLRMAYEE